MIEKILAKIQQTKIVPSEITDDFYINNFGVKVRRIFHAYLDRFIDIKSPSMLQSENLLETYTLIDAILSSKNKFTMVELGCGCGRWLALAYRLIIDNHSVDYELVGTEPEPQHYQWALSCMEDNCVPKSKYDIMNKAVVDRYGDFYLQVCNDRYPLSDPDSQKKWYGQSVKDQDEFMKYYDIEQSERRKDSYWGREVKYLTYGEGYVKLQDIELMTLASLLGRFEKIDLLTCDIQGVEASIFKKESMERIAGKVRRIHIGTHSNEIERELKILFDPEYWEPIFDFPCNLDLKHAHGVTHFYDGILSYRNRLLEHHKE